MPAIILSKLKQQTSALVTLFDQPDVFLLQFTELLEFYTNRTLRMSQVNQKSNLPAYHTPRPVLNQIENELGKLSDQFPDAAINLTKILWKASFFEAQLLSVFIMGSIPPALSISLLMNLPDKLYETKDARIKNALLTSGLARLREENPQSLMLLIKDWLNAPGPKTQTWGLSAFLPLIQQLGFDDLPQIFEILRPAIENISPSTQIEIQACINTIYRLSPVETIHYLSEIIQGTKDPQVLRVFTRILRDLPSEAQKELGNIIKNNAHPILEEK